MLVRLVGWQGLDAHSSVSWKPAVSGAPAAWASFLGGTAGSAPVPPGCHRTARSQPCRCQECWVLARLHLAGLGFPSCARRAASPVIGQVLPTRTSPGRIPLFSGFTWLMASPHPLYPEGSPDPPQAISSASGKGQQLPPRRDPGAGSSAPNRAGGGPGRRRVREAKPRGASPTGSAGAARTLPAALGGRASRTPRRPPADRHPRPRECGAHGCRWGAFGPREVLGSAARRRGAGAREAAHPAPPLLPRPAAVSGKGGARRDSYSAPAKPASRHLPGRRRPRYAPPRGPAPAAHAPRPAQRRAPGRSRPPERPRRLSQAVRGRPVTVGAGGPGGAAVSVRAAGGLMSSRHAPSQRLALRARSVAPEASRVQRGTQTRGHRCHLRDGRGVTAAPSGVVV